MSGPTAPTPPPSAAPVSRSTGPIYVARLLTDRAMAYLQSLVHPVPGRRGRTTDRSELLAGLRGAAAAVITLTERIDSDLLAAAGPQLRIIANVAVGHDNIDLPAANAAGVPSPTPPACWTGPAPTTRSR